MMPALENCVALSEPVGPTRLVGIITHRKCQTDFIILRADHRPRCSGSCGFGGKQSKDSLPQVE